MSMNIFRLTGDTCHVIGIVLVLLRLQKQQTAEGISVRTHETFLLVYCSRYLDLFTTFYSLYNSVMKVFYILSTVLIVAWIRRREPLVSTYDQARDSFPHWKLGALPAAILAFVVHISGNSFSGVDLMELFWTFSILLEVVAVVPQLVLLQQYRRDIDNTVTNYVLFMGLYRALYIVNWVYRSYTERGYYRHHYVVYACGVLQTLVYADFFYCYVTSKAAGQERVQYEPHLWKCFCSRYYAQETEESSGTKFHILLDDDEEENEDRGQSVADNTEPKEEKTTVRPPRIQVV